MRNSMFGQEKVMEEYEILKKNHETLKKDYESLHERFNHIESSEALKLYYKDKDKDLQAKNTRLREDIVRERSEKEKFKKMEETKECEKIALLAELMSKNQEILLAKRKKEEELVKVLNNYVELAEKFNVDEDDCAYLESLYDSEVVALGTPRIGKTENGVNHNANNTVTDGMIVIIDESDAEQGKPPIPRESNISSDMSVDRNQEEQCRNRSNSSNENAALGGIFTPGSEQQDMCSCYMELAKNSINQLHETETVCDMGKVGHESGAAGISMGMVVVPECEISEDGWRAIGNVDDITVGEEDVRIPWVNEINEEVPSHFRYISESVVFQNASVKFSPSSFSDEQSCPYSCIGDCLASAIRCNCANAVENGFAYTAAGVIRDEFLEARISETRDIGKHVLQFCKECPLQRAKKEYVVEPCKGHAKRKAIKECWIKCGCTKSCGNRVLQRGISRRLQVFFTGNGKGWGLRTLEKLPKGAFVCEYIGEILTFRELYQRRFEDKLTCPVILDAHWGSEELLEDDRVLLCLDGTCYGNIARFLNHRCIDANLIEIPVHVETPDQHYYHLAFFTTRDIEAMEELTWDYGIGFKGDEFLIKAFDCMCGSRCCKNKASKKTN